jgi:hypothetical protein
MEVVSILVVNIDYYMYSSSLNNSVVQKLDSPIPVIRVFGTVSNVSGDANPYEGTCCLHLHGVNIEII